MSAVSVARAVMTAGPATVARQVSTMLRTSAREPRSVPRLHATVVLLPACKAQFCEAGDAETKTAPLGTFKLSRVLTASSRALLSMPSV